MIAQRSHMHIITVRASLLFYPLLPDCKSALMLQAAQQDISAEREVYQTSRSGLDTMYTEAKKQLEDETRLRIVSGSPEESNWTALSFFQTPPLFCISLSLSLSLSELNSLSFLQFSVLHILVLLKRLNDELFHFPWLPSSTEPWCWTMVWWCVFLNVNECEKEKNRKTWKRAPHVCSMMWYSVLKVWWEFVGWMVCVYRQVLLEQKFVLMSWWCCFCPVLILHLACTTSSIAKLVCQLQPKYSRPPSPLFAPPSLLKHF